MPLGNYTYEQYLQLIASAESNDELRLIEEQYKEDFHNRFIDHIAYLELKTVLTIRAAELNIDRIKDNLLRPEE